MKTLSPKRIKVLEQIGRYQATGESPLVREMAHELGLAGESSLRTLINPLVQDGYLIKRGGGEKRHECRYNLSAKGAAYAAHAQTSGQSRVLLPRLGRVTAGVLQEVVQECEQFVDVGDSLKARPGDFLLEADGDSMIGDGILDGDWVQIRPGIRVNNNEIGVVQIKRDNGVYESTLKRIRFQPGSKTVTLRASNPAYDDLVLTARKVEVVGAYRGLLRRFK